MASYAILIAGLVTAMGLVLMVWRRAPFVRGGSIAAYAAVAMAVAVFACSVQVASDVAYADARAVA